MDILQSLLNATGWPGLVFMILSVIFGSIYIRRTAKSNADEIAKKASKEAIEALQTQVNVLNSRLSDIQTENRQLEQTLEALIDIFKSREIYITVSGHTINIKEGKETIITRISDESK